MKIPVNKIKPDPNQPRRTFNKEKMEALEASMKDHGFRKQYPIILNGKNIIVDGERRWRAAKKVGIKEVPVEVKKQIEDWERLLYQLQSEGVELSFPERNRAWCKLWEKMEGVVNERTGKTYKRGEIAIKLGVNPGTFQTRVREYNEGLKIAEQLNYPTLALKSSALDDKLPVFAEIAREKDSKDRKRIAKKALKEEWGRDKAREIMRALGENKLRKEQILAQDYSDPYEGSSQWKSRLEVAKSDVDIDEIKELDQTREHMEGQVDAFNRILEYGMKLKAAIEIFDFEVVTPQTRARLHHGLAKFAFVPADYIKELERYMVKNGELTLKDAKEIKMVDRSITIED